MTPEEQAALYRWDNLADDREVYDEIFDVAVGLVKSEIQGVRLTGSLLMVIVNEWERSRRSVPIPVISAAYSLAQELRAVAERPDDLVDEAVRVAALISMLAESIQGNAATLAKGILDS